MTRRDAMTLADRFVGTINANLFDGHQPVTIQVVGIDFDDHATPKLTITFRPLGPRSDPSFYRSENLGQLPAEGPDVAYVFLP